MKTLLQIVQAAAQQMGIPSPTLVAGSTVTDTIQLQALLNQLLDDLLRDFEWQAMTNAYRFTTQSITTTGSFTSGSAIVTGIPSTTGLDDTYQIVAVGVPNDVDILTVDSATQITMNQVATVTGVAPIVFCKVKYSLPSDYDHVIPETQWDKSKHWRMLGPMSAQQWEWLKSGYIATGPRIRWRLLQGLFQIWPATSSGELLGMEYVSNAPVRAANGTRKQSFTVDTDTSIFPDGLLITGLKNMYYLAKGLGGQYEAPYAQNFGIAKAQDGGMGKLSMAPEPLNVLIGWENIPDSLYGI